MNRQMLQLALHKDRRLVPIFVTVMRLKGLGEDTLFIAVLQVRRAAPLDRPCWGGDREATQSACSGGRHA